MADLTLSLKALPTIKRSVIVSPFRHESDWFVRSNVRSVYERFRKVDNADEFLKFHIA